jgi:hypothetical protein
MKIVMTLEELKAVGHCPQNCMINADCLIAMKYIADKSVDCILCDLPYG